MSKCVLHAPVKSSYVAYLRCNSHLFHFLFCHFDHTICGVVCYRNQGSGAPFATGENNPAVSEPQQVVGDDYLSPKQRQANVSCLNGCRFSGLSPV